jgi:arylesterase/paraoxonase
MGLVDSGADNLEWDQQGNLWIGAHPRMFDFLAHAADEHENSPSQALKISLDTDSPVITEVYLDDGSAISGSSVAAVYEDTLLIGSVFEPRLLVCSLGAASPGEDHP